MKILTVCLLLIGTLYVSPVFCQVNAITETGDEVVLYDDGTWTYINDSIFQPKVIPLSTVEYSKPKFSSFLVKSKRVNIGIYINPKKWKFNKAVENEDAEFEFELKGQDLYAILITEKMEIPIETLRGIAVENAKSVAPDVSIVKEEYRWSMASSY